MGEHSREILLENGYSNEEVGRLIEDSVISEQLSRCYQTFTQVGCGLTPSQVTAEYAYLMIEAKDFIEVLPLIGPGVVAVLLFSGLVIKIGRDMFSGQNG